MEDQNIECKECGKNFIWSSQEQAFFKQKGFKNVPARCPECRGKARERRDESQASFETNCFFCGQKGQVPFEPDGKPIYCEKCFKAMEEDELGKPPTAK